MTNPENLCPYQMLSGKCLSICLPFKPKWGPGGLSMILRLEWPVANTFEILSTQNYVFSCISAVIRNVKMSILPIDTSLCHGTPFVLPVHITNSIELLAVEARQAEWGRVLLFEVTAYPLTPTAPPIHSVG